MEQITIKTETINLNQFLKWANLVASGGEAKLVIQEGKVKVNQELEQKRTRSLEPGDIVEYAGVEYKVVSN